MKRLTILAALAAVVALPACARTIPADQTTITAALRGAKPGDVIRVSGVLTGPINSALFAAPGVVIEAGPGASIAHDPRSGWFSIQNSAGLTLRGFPVKSAGGAAIGVMNSERIALEDIDCYGAGPVEKGGGCAAFRNSTDVVVRRAKVHDLAGGISFNNVRGILIEASDFRELWNDAVKIASPGGVRVEGNRFTDFRGPPLHLDAIQLIGVSATEPVAGVSIRDNVYTRGTGSPAQFIFMSDSVMGYTDFMITGNSAFGPSFHGVTINKPIEGVVEGNYLQPSAALWDGQLLVPWVKMIEPGKNVKVRDNILPKPGKDAAAMTAWTAALSEKRKALAPR